MHFMNACDSTMINLLDYFFWSKNVLFAYHNSSYTSWTSLTASASMWLIISLRYRTMNGTVFSSRRSTIILKHTHRSTHVRVESSCEEGQTQKQQIKTKTNKNQVGQ